MLSFVKKIILYSFFLLLCNKSFSQAPTCTHCEDELVTCVDNCYSNTICIQNCADEYDACVFTCNEISIENKIYILFILAGLILFFNYKKKE